MRMRVFAINIVFSTEQKQVFILYRYPINLMRVSSSEILSSKFVRLYFIFFLFCFALFLSGVISFPLTHPTPIYTLVIFHSTEYLLFFKCTMYIHITFTLFFLLFCFAFIIRVHIPTSKHPP